MCEENDGLCIDLKQKMMMVHCINILKTGKASPIYEMYVDSNVWTVISRNGCLTPFNVMI